MRLVLDAAVHMGAANLAGMPLDERGRASIMFSLSPFSRTVTLSRGTTATTEKVAPAGFQHLVQPQA